MDFDKMLTLATEVMLDCDQVEKQFLNTKRGLESYPRIKTAEGRHRELYESLAIELNEKQLKLLIALDDNFSARFGAITSLTLAVGVIIGMKHSGVPDEHIEKTMLTLLPSLRSASTREGDQDAGDEETAPNINKLAREMVEKARVDLAGNAAHSDYNLKWRVESEVGLLEQNRLRDAVSYNWREAQKKAETLYTEIAKFTPLIEHYAECRDSEVGVTEDVWFALGFAAAGRLMGK